MPSMTKALVRRTFDAFNANDASAVHLLCDRHEARGVAFRFIDETLTETTVTYGELAKRSKKIATVLAELGVQRGDRVATLMGKTPDLPAVLLGIWRLGAVYVPLFTAFASDALVDRLERSAARVVVTDAEQVVKVPAADFTVLLSGGSDTREGVLDFDQAVEGAREWDESPPTGPAVPMVHMFTSGTTGKPKTVVHPLAYLANFQAYLELGLGVPSDAVYWNAADPGWAYGLYGAIVAPLAAGIPSLIHTQKFDAIATVRVLAKYEVTDFAAAPTVYRALRSCSEPKQGLSLRRLSSAGEPLAPDVFDWAQTEFGLKIHDHWGQTEHGMCAGFPHHPALVINVTPSAMGRSFPGWCLVALDLIDDTVAKPGAIGRLAVDIENSLFFTFSGYGIDRDNNADRLTRDGRYCVTGDLVSMEEDGLIHFSSRDDDVILMAGYRIGPFDVESALVSHPAVLETAVIAAPDEMRGEVIHAYVVPKPGIAASADLVVELQTWVKEKYAAHAYPRTIEFVPSLPKTPSGKIQRAVLRQSLAAEAATT